MSADTTVVIAAYTHPGSSELAYTAAVVQAVENLFDEEFALETAKAIFLSRPRVWFSGTGGLSRAKQFANLLAEETRANGILEYEERPIIEIGEDRVHTLSRKGKRKPPVQWGQFSDPSEPWMQESVDDWVVTLDKILARAHHS